MLLTIRVTPGNQKPLLDMANQKQVDEIILDQWKTIDAILKGPFSFSAYQLEQHNIAKSRLTSIPHVTLEKQVQELHNNFMYDNCFVNIGKVIQGIIKAIM